MNARKSNCLRNNHFDTYTHKEKLWQLCVSRASKEAELNLASEKKKISYMDMHVFHRT